jgi:riboflavin biosynthesis pyrimidine reductase
MEINGPGAPFATLFDEDTTDGSPLPPPFEAIYGRWPLPTPTSRPYVYTNFVTGRDGRVSFAEPGKAGGGPVSGYNRHDIWGMALLRARADAVLIGASALHDAPRHRWTPPAIFPDDGDAWAWLREHEGRAPVPLHVIVTRSGNLDPRSVVLTGEDVPVLVVTTDDGAARARPVADTLPNVRVMTTGDALDYARLARHLHDEHGVATVLSEGGPNIYGGLLTAGVVDDEFITLSPIVVGGSDDQPRPSLIEGVAFSPDDPPRSRLLTLRRAGDFLFMQSRYG